MKYKAALLSGTSVILDAISIMAVLIYLSGVLSPNINAVLTLVSASLIFQTITGYRMGKIRGTTPGYQRIKIVFLVFGIVLLLYSLIRWILQV